METRQKAIEILRRNDRGGYTVPTATGLYPAQWNWDSCLVALGLAQFDEPRAVAEIETLFAGQWPDGMVPHILFHGDDSSYFPNASVWQAGPTGRSSGITQPLVAATVVRRLFERDIGFAAADHRPRRPEYDRYINLVIRFRDNDYRADRLYDISPFRVADIGFNAILQRANRDLRSLLAATGDVAGAAEVATTAQKTSAAIEQCWQEKDGFFYGVDTHTGKPIRKPGIAGFLPLFADAGVATRHPQLVQRLESWLARVAYGVPSFEPGQPEFEPQRYWRGPVWLIVNWMLIDGLRQNGRADLAERIRRDSLALVERAGFAEYFNPLTGESLGGSSFSWTAAMYLHLAADSA